MHSTKGVQSHQTSFRNAPEHAKALAKIAVTYATNAVISAHMLNITSGLKQDLTTLLILRWNSQLLNTKAHVAKFVVATCLAVMPALTAAVNRANARLATNHVVWNVPIIDAPKSATLHVSHARCRANGVPVSILLNRALSNVVRRVPDFPVISDVLVYCSVATSARLYVAKPVLPHRNAVCVIRKMAALSI